MADDTDDPVRWVIAADRRARGSSPCSRGRAGDPGVDDRDPGSAEDVVVTSDAAALADHDRRST